MSTSDLPSLLQDTLQIVKAMQKEQDDLKARLTAFESRESIDSSRLLHLEEMQRKDAEDTEKNKNDSESCLLHSMLNTKTEDLKQAQIDLATKEEELKQMTKKLDELKLHQKNLEAKKFFQSKSSKPAFSFSGNSKDSKAKQPSGTESAKPIFSFSGDSTFKLQQEDSKAKQPGFRFSGISENLEAKQPFGTKESTPTFVIPDYKSLRLNNIRRLFPKIKLDLDESGTSSAEELRRVTKYKPLPNLKLSGSKEELYDEQLLRIQKHLISSKIPERHWMQLILENYTTNESFGLQSQPCENWNDFMYQMFRIYPFFVKEDEIRCEFQTFTVDTKLPAKELLLTWIERGRELSGLQLFDIQRARYGRFLEESKLSKYSSDLDEIQDYDALVKHVKENVPAYVANPGLETIKNPKFCTLTNVPRIYYDSDCCELVE
ncbi:hypothetical protein CANARDRAFT_9256 [[Candida] arabinofermentans NRRL YB-2248]|uniref:Uncharacterized protein n=1 Tax=[Candida] arabinofermentans NRRL YB-2248 TaxID=983967 RepID=A0A1E4SW86_9ASCO|nr:hypothetical protein CANARDRAFT_9256 [[Candida] arabinofermentans NRRL YB-2248]